MNMSDRQLLLDRITKGVWIFVDLHIIILFDPRRDTFPNELRSQRFFTDFDVCPRFGGILWHNVPQNLLFVRDVSNFTILSSVPGNFLIWQ